MNKQLNLAHFLSSNKRTRPSSPATMQLEQIKSSSTLIIILGETHTITTSSSNYTLKKIRILGNSIRVSESVTIGNLFRVSEEGFPRSRKP